MGTTQADFQHSGNTPVQHREIYKSQQVRANHRETSPHSDERNTVQPHRPGRTHALNTARQFWQCRRLELEASGADGGRARASVPLGHSLPQLVGDARSHSGEMPVKLVSPGDSFLWSRVCHSSGPRLMGGIQLFESGPEVSAATRRQLMQLVN